MECVLMLKSREKQFAKVERFYSFRSMTMQRLKL